MYKTFTLAAAIAFLPLSQKNATTGFAENNFTKTADYIFPYKNVVNNNPFEPEKKPTEAWSQNWYASAQENIRKSEYNFKWEKRLNAYCTPNRRNNLRFFYNDKGFAVEPRTTKIPIGGFDPLLSPGEIKYRTVHNWKVNFNLNKKQFGKGLWKVAANTAEYITDKITVQYINNDEGMRQNFIVRSPLSKINELRINLNLKTKLKHKLNGNQLQFFHKKTNVLNFEDLKVWDANNKPLTASFQKNKKGNYCIQVDSKDAAYPITIDPISTTPATNIESNQAFAGLGISVASAGDVNGDGYSDVIIGALAYDNGQTDEGAAFVYHGSNTGINNTAAATLEGNLANAQMGWSVATAGDVNADGYNDIIVGLRFYSNGQANEGGAAVYHGSATGINTTAAAMLQSNEIGAQMGWSVATAGDVNGDGYSDVIVGVPYFYGNLGGEGAAFVYHGSATGIITTVAATVQSNQVSAEMGKSVASAGDVNGDGYSDIIVGAALYDNGQVDEGVAIIYHGSATGINTSVAALVDCNQPGVQMGFSVASAGDVNSDGYSDVIVGARYYSNGQTVEGAAFVYHGSATGINTAAATTLEGNQDSVVFGWSVASAGDINGDGYSDIIVGAPYYSNGQTDEGVAFVFSGSNSGINTTPVTLLECNQASATMGICVASAGDVNGDGYSDVISGAYVYDNGQTNEGAAFVYHGSAAGLSTTPNNTPDDADQGGATFGVSVASAGDVNGDGYGDVIIGANDYDDGANNSEGRAFVYHGSAAGLSATPNSTPDDSDQIGAFFANSVACAGDVNGDGYSDVIIGAFGYDDGANTNEGRAFVYYGSTAGLSASPNSTPDDADQGAAAFGQSVANAGDVNGDGYSDVIIGAPLYNDAGNTSEGRAYIYYGSAAGLSATPGGTPDDADQAGAFFGYSVACAGDVNGDGYSDVIIGAYLYDDGFTNEGKVFVYHGSATGLSSTPNSTPDDANLAQAYFGDWVSGAGDVNGDGYSDVVIGSPGYTSGANSNEGRAFVYYGSAAGLGTIPDVTLDDTNQAFSYFGVSVSGAGDINGDGYSDVVVGASGFNDGANNGEGRAFVYYGSAAGLSTIPGSTPDDADQAGAAFGFSVSGAGDVNGDGYSDLIIGAYSYDDGAINNEGRAFLYNGNELTANKRNNLRLFNTNLTTPINSSNFLFSNFGAGLYGKSFLGRAKGKLVWETRLNYNAYSGTPITNSTFFTAQQATYADMGLTGIELKSVINKIAGASRFTKLRARIKYDPATSITGQVYSPWRNISSVIDANNLGALPIELISFNAAWQQKGKTARLDFKTDKENGICCFDIEKSSNGFNFYSIGTLPAKNISGAQSYSFIDGNATGKNQFYRIKIKGISGQQDYSNIQQLQNDKATEILVFPNPTTDKLRFQFNKWYAKMDVQVINSAGQTVQQYSGLPIGGQTLTLPVQDLPAGRYWIRLQSGDEKQLLQFVKQ